MYIEKMIHGPFGDGLLLPSTLLHSGHYGSRSNLRFHGILSTDPWTTTKLGYLKGFIEHVYGTSEEQTQILYDNDYNIEELCPLCFNFIGEKGKCSRSNTCKLRSGSDIGMNALSGNFFFFLVF